MIDSPNEPTLAACKDCKLEIPTGAKRCYRCGSYQNFRRLINASGTVLALLVALISVAGIVGSTLVDFFTPDSDKITVSVLGAEQTGLIYLMASNTGTKHGSIGQIVFPVCIPADDAPKNSPKSSGCFGQFLSVKDRERGAGFLGPGESQQLVIFAPKGAKSFADYARKQLGDLDAAKLQKKIFSAVSCPGIEVEVIGFRGVRTRYHLNLERLYCRLFIAPWLAQVKNEQT